MCSLPPCGAGESHVEILDSNRACESAAGFQSCAHDPISIPMLRPFAENWPHAIALPTGGRGTLPSSRRARVSLEGALVAMAVNILMPALSPTMEKGNL